MKKILISTLKVISLEGYSHATRLVSKILLTRILSVYSFGIISLILLWSGLLAPFLNFGTNKLITKVIGSNNDKKGSGLGVALWSALFLLLISGLVLIAMVIMSDLLSNWLNIKNWHLYVILALAIMMAILQWQFSIMHGLSRPFEGKLPHQFLAPTLLILFLLFGYYSTVFEYNLDWIIAGYSAIYGVSVFVGIVLIYKFFIRKLRNIKPDFSDRKAWRNFSAFNFLTNNSRIYLSKLDLIFAGLLLTPELLALYVIPCNIFTTLSVVNHTFNLILEPKISYFHDSGNLNRLIPTLRSNIYIQLLLSLIFYALIYFFGNYVLLLFGEDYAAMHEVLQVTCLALIVQAIAGPAGVMLTMTGNVKERLYTNLISLAIGSIFYPLIIHQQYGLMGLAYVFVFTMLFSRIVQIFMVNKLLKINLLKLMISAEK